MVVTAKEKGNKLQLLHQLKIELSLLLVVAIVVQNAVAVPDCDVVLSGGGQSHDKLFPGCGFHPRSSTSALSVLNFSFLVLTCPPYHFQASTKGYTLLPRDGVINGEASVIIVLITLKPESPGNSV